MQPKVFSIAFLVLVACGAKTGLPFDTGSSLPGSPALTPARCVSAEVISAESAPIDLFLLVDSSNSMLEVTEQDTHKWAAVQLAIERFVLSPGSSGAGVALSFFPLLREEAPTDCFNDTDCGVYGPCQMVKICWPSGLYGCQSDDDCKASGVADDACKPLGGCQFLPQELCLPHLSPVCDEASTGDELGSCLPSGYCKELTSCDISEYQAQVPDALTLPGGAGAVRAALLARNVGGGTPILPAVQGTLRGAMDWASTHPGRTPILVLATDGEPSQCDPAAEQEQSIDLAIEHIADAVSEGYQAGVMSFVIGVFAPDEQKEARPRLDSIATAGGSKESFVVTPNANLSNDFFASLEEARRTGAACSFALPDPSPNHFDPERFSVSVSTPGKGLQNLVHRLPDQCDATGFFLDSDLSGAHPRRMILCPAACEQIAGASSRTITIRSTCG